MGAAAARLGPQQGVGTTIGKALCGGLCQPWSGGGSAPLCAAGVHPEQANGVAVAAVLCTVVLCACSQHARSLQCRHGTSYGDVCACAFTSCVLERRQAFTCTGPSAGP